MAGGLCGNMSVWGCLWTGVCSLIRCALKTAYPVITEKVDRILVHGAAMVG